MPKTRISIIDLNCRRLNWTSRRRRSMAKVMRRRSKSLITLQECTDQMAKDIFADLGHNWAYTQHGNVVTGWYRPKWSQTKIERHNLNAPVMRRRLLVVHLQHIDGAQLRLGNTHLTVNVTGEATWRARQARDIVEILGDDPSPLMVCGDVNESDVKGAVRTTFAKAGLLDAWAKTGNLTRKTYNSFTGFLVTRRQSRRLDVMVSNQAVRVYRAGIYLTGRAADHNMLGAGIEI